MIIEIALFVRLRLIKGSEIIMELTQPKVIKDIVAKFGFSFSKGLGQNFLLDKNVLKDIVEAAEPEEGVLEVGPGFGVLTKELAMASQKVVTIELDKRLFPVLDYTLSEFDNVKIVEGDILKINLNNLLKEEFKDKKISVAANLPYYITTPIITMLLEGKYPIKKVVVMVQKEVAKRLCAEAGSKDYGAISVLCRYFTNPRIVTIVPAESFYPPPKVDSAVVCLDICEKPNVTVKDEKMFFKVVKGAFSQRRKTLLNCLSSHFGIDKEKTAAIIEKCGIEPGIRGEKLDIDDFARLADEFFEIL